MRDVAVSSGRVERLWVKRAHRGAMDSVAEATLVAGQGVAGSVDRSRRRQVTLIERERWEHLMQTLGAAIDPSARRANVMLAGISLEETRGRVLRIGDTRLEIGGETRPCERMDEACPGLRRAMEPHWGGGVFAQVLTGGIIRLGDAAAWER